MYRLERQDQFNRLLEGLSRCVVETLRDKEKIGYAKEKWPARWWSTLTLLLFTRVLSRLSFERLRLYYST
jgi:hypothetical protein